VPHVQESRTDRNRVVDAEQQVLDCLKQDVKGATPTQVVAAMKGKTRLMDAEIRDVIWRLVAAGKVQLAPDLRIVVRDLARQPK
jgi:hypothetical protein